MFSLKKLDITYIKNLLLTTVLGGVIGLLNYFFNIFVIRFTDKDVFSTYSAVLGIAYLMQMISTAIQSVITKAVAKNKNDNDTYYKWYAYKYLSVTGVVAAILLFLFRGVVAQIASIPEGLVTYLAIGLGMSFVCSIAKGFLYAQERIMTANLVALAETIFKFVIGFFAIRAGGNVPVLIVANFLPQFIGTFALLPLISNTRKIGKLIRLDVKDIIYTSMFYLLLALPYTLDLILVNEKFRADYSSVSLLGKIIYFACILSASVMFARLSNESDAQKRKKSLLISLGFAFMIGFVISVAYFILGELIIKLTVGEEYLGIRQYLGVFGLCMTGFACVYMVANYFISQNVYSYLVVLALSSAMQVVIYKMRNDSLQHVVQGQVFLYIILTVVTFIFLFISFKKHEKTKY